jgi:hypothetical protein
MNPTRRRIAIEDLGIGGTPEPDVTRPMRSSPGGTDGWSIAKKHRVQFWDTGRSGIGSVLSGFGHPPEGGDLGGGATALTP